MKDSIERIYLGRYFISAQNCVGQSGSAEFVDSFELTAEIEKHFESLKLFNFIIHRLIVSISLIKSRCQVKHEYVLQN